MQPFHRKALFIVGMIALITSLGLGFAHGETQPQQRYPRIDFGVTSTFRPARIILRTHPPQKPKTVAVLKVQELSLEERKAMLLQLFRSLPMEDYYTPPQIEWKLARLERANWASLPKGEPMSSQIGEWDVDVWPSGQFMISSNPPPDKRKADLPAPTKAEARKVADAFLPRIASQLPEAVNFTGVGPASSMSRGKAGTEIISYHVSYMAKKNGVPVGGISITVASGPRIEAVRSTLRRTVEDSLVTTLSPEEALARLQKGEGQAGTQLRDATAYVDSIKLVYWVKAPAHSMSYLMPIYIFGGEATAEGKKSEKWGGTIEAIRPEYLEKPQAGH